MKRCATCNQTYTDDLMFCLSDGTPLANLIEEVEQQTVIRPMPAVETLKSADSSGSIFKYIAAALGLLLILVLIGGAGMAWILWPRNGATPANSPAKNDLVNAAASPVPSPFRTSDNLNTNQSNLKDKEEALERERRRLADERKKLEDDKRLQTEKTELEPPRFNDPGTARISFRRGSVGETVSGTVGRSRSYVLRTLAGQYLSASIRSAGGCVVFSGGSSSTGFTTGSGDTRLTVENNCDRPSTFSMSLTVR
ncbi:MAG: hypothetical protein ABL999_06440 [Pyrinomonadaceae bacterium]